MKTGNLIFKNYYFVIIGYFSNALQSSSIKDLSWDMIFSMGHSLKVTFHFIKSNGSMQHRRKSSVGRSKSVWACSLAEAPVCPINWTELGTCSSSGELACSTTQVLHISIISVVCLVEFVFKEIWFHEVIYLWSPKDFPRAEAAGR